MTPADLAELLRGTAASVLADRGLDVSVLPETLTVERPRNPEHGDYATNIAMQVAKKVGTNPRELAGWIAEALTAADGIESAEIAGPGFLNIRLDKDAQGAIVVSVLEAGASYARVTPSPARRSTSNSSPPTPPDRFTSVEPLGRSRRRARTHSVRAGWFGNT